MESEAVLFGEHVYLFLPFIEIAVRNFIVKSTFQHTVINW